MDDLVQGISWQGCSSLRKRRTIKEKDRSTTMYSLCGIQLCNDHHPHSVVRRAPFHFRGAETTLNTGVESRTDAVRFSCRGYVWSSYAQTCISSRNILVTILRILMSNDEERKGMVSRMNDKLKRQSFLLQINIKV